ncbi:RNA-dependent RNA polymerase [Joa yellow blotch virus]|uniref:RNA-directed RNA polymerase n=1 Tax=joa yellow blotch associated virus TaxID=3070922 RepID=A0AAE7UUJ8_9RHAB|nr:RNA-dependent RNA polymerase [Joa yellow blotch virus]QUI75406.1 RNA-dependent RNA polymerase [joa yellow blotch associated virus]
MEDWEDKDSFNVEENEWGTDKTSEDMHEGGDYHLQSALKTLDDYRKNFIFKNEEANIRSSVGEMGVMLTNISAISFWWGLAILANRINDNYIMSDLMVHGLLSADTQKIGDLVRAEMRVAYRGDIFPDVNISRHVSESIMRVLTRFPNLLPVTRLMCFVLLMKNNLKTIRTKGIIDFPNLDHMSVVGSNLVVQVEPNFIITFNTDLLHMQVGDRRFWCPMQYFINASDKIQERHNIILYTSVCHPLIPNLSPSVDLLMKVLKIFDTLLGDLGNDGYTDVSVFEAMIVGIIIDRDDPDLVLEPGEFTNSIMNDVSDRGRPYVREMAALLHNLSVDQLADLHGLYRIWGHPIINIDGGLAKMQKVSLQEKITDNELGKLVGRKFKEMFFKNYRQKHGFYPPHSLPGDDDEDDLYDDDEPEEHTYLLKCLSTGVPFSIVNTGYSLDDWDKVTIKKTFEIPYSWNIVHTIKDKAISPNRTELCNNLALKGHVFNQNMRRVILKTISTPMVPMRQFLTSVATVGLAAIFLLIGLYPKERELKVMPRFFSLMTHELRLYFTATEQLLNDKVPKYFPEITMSLNLLDMQKKMGKMSGRQKEQTTTVTYVVNMDFVKWNQQMRKWICTYVFRPLGELFGLDFLYDITHDLLRRCVIYLSSGERDLTPDPETGVKVDGKYAWDKDGSGKEGLRQKGWTIMTDCDIKLIADKLGMDASLVGGGDNQVLTITLTTADIDENGNISAEGKIKIREKMRNFMKELQQHFDRRGLPLKTSETWTSTSLFMYNKHMYYNGRPLRTVLKQVSRCFPFSNSSIMSTALMCNSISTTLKAAMQKEHYLVGVITMKALWGSYIANLAMNMNPLFYCTKGSLLSGRYTITRDRKEEEVSMTERNREIFWAKVMYLPSVMGGPGIANCFNLTQRGFPDPVTEGFLFLLSMYRELHMINPRLGAAIQTMLGISFGKEPNFEKLVEDPSSISHDAPSHSTSVLREKARAAVMDMATGVNKEFVDLMRVADKNKELEFYKSLCSGKELDPKVLHEIAKASMYGVTNSLLSRVDKTRTIKRMNETVSVVSDLSKAEERYVGYLLVRDNRPHDLELAGCTRVLADTARNLSYGKKVLGATVPHPSEYLQIYPSNHPDCLTGSITVRMQPASREERTEVVGPCKPYYGSYTKERFRATEIASAYGDEDVLKKATNIQKLIGWRYSAESKFGELITAVFKAVTNIDPSHLHVREEVIRGSYDHRRNTDSNTHGGIPNFLNTISTFLSICTSTWTEHARSGTNEYIHFQMCMITCILQMMPSLTTREITPKITEYHAHEVCGTCITEIENIDPTLTAPQGSVSFPTLIGNSLVYMDAEEVRIDYHKRVLIEETNNLAPLLMNTDTASAEMHLLEDCVSTMMILEAYGIKHHTAKSYMILARERMDLELCLRRFREKSVSMRQLLPFVTTVIPSSLNTLCDTPNGYVVKFSALGWTTEGTIEGTTSSCKIDHWDSDVPVSFISIINSTLGSVHFQVVMHLIGRFPILLSCLDCLGILRLALGKTASYTTNMSLCQYHNRMTKRLPITNIHPDNVLKGRQITEDPVPYLLTTGITDLQSVEPSHESTMLDLPAPTKLQEIGEILNNNLWSNLVQNFIMNVWVDFIVIDNSLESLEIVVGALRVREGFIKPVYICVDALSREETGVIYEKFRRSTLRGCPVSVVYDTADAPGTVGLMVSFSLDWKLLMSRSRSIYGIFGGSQICKLPEDYKRRIEEVYYDSSLIYSSFLSVVGFDRQVKDQINLSALAGIMTLGEKFDNDRYGGRGGRSSFTTVSGIRGLISRYKFRNRYEMITLFQRGLEKIERIDTFQKGRTKTPRIQTEMTLLYVSVMAHCEEDMLDDVMKIKRMNLNSIRGIISPQFRRARVECLASKFYMGMRDYLAEKPHIVFPREKILQGVNCKSQRSTGVNVAAGAEDAS